jgi:hypothetical protein
MTIDENRVGLLDRKPVALWFAAPSAPPMSIAATCIFTMTTEDEQRPDHRPDGRGKGKDQGDGDRGGWHRGFANAWMVLGAAPSGLLIGWFIDRSYGTAPWWMLGLSLLFLAASLYQLVKDSWK